METRSVGESQLQRVIRDLHDAVTELSTQYRENGEPVTDDSSSLHKFCYKLEYLLQFDQKDKSTVLGTRKDYWDYFCDCLAKSKGANEGIRFVKSIPELKTSLGKGRALIRHSLLHQRLADTLQQCLMNQRVTSDWYYMRSPFLKPHLNVDMVNHLYELNEVQFDVPCRGHDLDSAWPTFARKSLGTGGSPTSPWRPPSRCSSMGSLAGMSSPVVEVFSSSDADSSLPGQLNETARSNVSDDLRLELNQSELRQQELRAELSQSEQNWQEVKLELNQSEKTRKELHTELERSRKKQRELHAELSQSEQKRQQLLEELDQSSKKQQDLGTELAQSEQKRQQLLEELDQSAKKQQDLGTELAQSEQKRQQLLEELDQSVKKQQDLGTELAQSEQKRQQLLEKVCRKEEEVSELRVTVEELRSRPEQIGVEEVEERSRVTELQEALGRLQRTLADREEEAGELRRRLQQLEELEHTQAGLREAPMDSAEKQIQGPEAGLQREAALLMEGQANEGLRAELQGSSSQSLELEGVVHQAGAGVQGEGAGSQLEQELREEMVELRVRLQEAVEAQGAAGARLEVVEEERELLRGQVEQLQSLLEELKHRTQEEAQEEEREAREEQLQAREEQLQAREEQLRAREEQLRAREEQLQAREEQLQAPEEADALRFQMSSENVSHQKQLQGLNDEPATVRAELATVRAELATARAELATERVELASARAALERMPLQEAQVSELQVQVTDSCHSQLMEEKDRRIAQCEKELQALKDNLARIEQDLAESRSACEGLRVSLRTVSEEKESCHLKMSAEIDDLSRTKSNLEERVVQLIKEKDALWQKSRALEQGHQRSDREANVCTGCHSQFGWLLRRHQCGLCGRAFCSSCSNHTVASHSGGGKTRCCQDCYTQHRAAAERSLLPETPDTPSNPPAKPTSASGGMDDDVMFDIITEDEVKNIHGSNPPGAESEAGQQGTPDSTGTHEGSQEQIPNTQDAEIHLLKSGELTLRVSLSLAEVQQFGGGSRELFIKSSSYSVISMEVGGAGPTLSWVFSSEPKSISFSVVHRPGPQAPLEEAKVLIPLTRCNSHKEKVKGQLKAMSPGTYLLIFDNSFSRFVSKKVLYHLAVDESVQDGSDLS